MGGLVRATDEADDNVTVLRLCIITLDFRPRIGGVQEYLYEITRRLGLQYKVKVLTATPGPLPASIPFEQALLTSTSPLDMARCIRSFRPNNVLVGHAHPRLLLSAALAAWGRYGCIAHGNDFLAAQNRWHRPLFNWLLSHAQPLITNSAATSIRLRKLGLREPIIVRPGTDPKRFSATHTETQNHLTLLTVARLVHRKGIDVVLRAMPVLLVMYPSLSYYIAGDGPARTYLERLAAELNVDHAVRFLGFVASEELPAVYREADVFVMPTREVVGSGSVEGFGIVYLEASASGLPVVAARSGGATEAIRDGVTGFLVPPDDTEALTTTLKNLLINPELRERLGQAGRRWVESEMNWDRAADQMQNALAVIDTG